MSPTLDLKQPAARVATTGSPRPAPPVIGMANVRTEGDIVAQTMNAFAQIVDLLLIVDCGSTDDTVEQIQRVCDTHNHVLFLGCLGPMHARQVRRHIWEKFRSHLPPEAWWLIADADEFVDDDLAAKLQRADEMRADHMFGVHVNFYWSAADHERWLSGAETLADRKRPIQERRRYYRMQTAQRRLFRNASWLRWNKDESFPENLSAPASERVVFRHYQYRDPEQIRARIAVRSTIPRDDSAMKENQHWHREHMEDAISHDPRLRLWEPGAVFETDPELPPAIHQPRVKSIIKYARAMAHAAATPQEPSRYFHDLDASALVHRMKR